MKKEWVQGSFTIEAAMIMGVVLFAIMSLLDGTRIVYNRVLLTAYEYEYAITKREKELTGLWGQADTEVTVELEELKPVSFLRTAQMLMKE